MKIERVTVLWPVGEHGYRETAQLPCGYKRCCCGRVLSAVGTQTRISEWQNSGRDDVRFYVITHFLLVCLQP